MVNINYCYFKNNFLSKIGKTMMTIIEVLVENPVHIQVTVKSVNLPWEWDSNLDIVVNIVLKLSKSDHEIHIFRKEMTHTITPGHQHPTSITTGQNIINWTSRDEHERRACKYARVKFNLRVRVNATQMTWKCLAIVWMIVWMQLC